MVDYRRPLEFGVFPIPDAGEPRAAIEMARMADRLELDLVGVQDHPYQRRFLDAMVLLATIAEATERVRVFPDVANLPLRPPGVLAKTAASIDLVSGGRFELGLGAGGFPDAAAAMGAPPRSPGEAVDALGEAIDVIRMIWSGERGLRYPGRHYRLDGVHGGPAPAHRIAIWLGSGGRRSLQLLGRSGDGWVPSSSYLPPERLDERHAIIDEAATAAGRDPAEIRRLYNINGTITDGPSGGFLDGPRSQWVDELSSVALEHGIDTFILWPGGDPIEQLHVFADIVPEVRERVAAARR